MKLPLVNLKNTIPENHDIAVCRKRMRIHRIDTVVVNISQLCQISVWKFYA